MNREQRRAMASKSLKGGANMKARRGEFAAKLAAETEKRKVRLPLFAKEAHASFDARAEELRAADNPAITCTKGCSACCKQLVLTSYAEASRIVLERPEAVEKAVFELCAAEDAYESLPTARRGVAIDPFNNPEALNELSSEWWRLQRDCPFLGEDKLCTIYEQRPLACRQLFVVSDPATCAIPEPGAEVLSWRPEAFGIDVAELWDKEAKETKNGHVLLGPLPDLIMHVRATLVELKKLGGGR